MRAGCYTLTGMPRGVQGSIHIFRIAGVDVFLHWSWFAVAVLEVASRLGKYSSVVWNILEYLALFAIVLLHEFGHALACRQVGGSADRILLWPLGGVAFVNPPQRPGATLWSIAAGPLVNLLLIPAFLGIGFIIRITHFDNVVPDLYHVLWSAIYIDTGLLAFNILPIFPLDGGQILRSLLWYFMGSGRSLAVATGIGILADIAFVGYAVYTHSSWLVLIAGYMLMNCWGGLKKALALMRAEKDGGRAGVVCPNCHKAPPIGLLWKCAACGRLFDAFETLANCPHCGYHHESTRCEECRKSAPIGAWIVRDPSKPETKQTDSVAG